MQLEKKTILAELIRLRTVKMGNLSKRGHSHEHGLKKKNSAPDFRFKPEHQASYATLLPVPLINCHMIRLIPEQ